MVKTANDPFWEIDTDSLEQRGEEDNKEDAEDGWSAKKKD